MKLTGQGRLLRVFVGERDVIDHKALYEVIVLKAREGGLAGATVLRGMMGFGARSRTLHTAKILRLSEDLPMVVEIVDSEERIAAFLPVVEELFRRSGCGGLVTTERAEVIQYTAGG